MYVDRILRAADHDDAISELVVTALMERGLCLDDAVLVTDWYVRRVMDEWMLTSRSPS